MREAIIILPFAKIGARPIVEFEAQLLTAFGGFTVTQATGAWRDPVGCVVREPVSVYTIACEDCCEPRGRDTDDTLRLLARHYGQRLAQDCVYVRFYSGDVELVDTAGAILEAAE